MTKCKASGKLEATIVETLRHQQRAQYHLFLERLWGSLARDVRKDLSKRFHYGGQAVIEGVMMRGPRLMKTAVRRPDGQIISMTEPLSLIYTGCLRKMPFLRGIFALIETLILGVKALMFSANVAVEAELKEKSNPLMMWPPVIFGVALGVGLFVVLPMLVTHYGVDRITNSAMLSNLADGLICVAVFFGYLGAVNLIPDIRRLFAYHGAEHKVVNALEGGAELKIDEIQRFSTAHIRCGSSFLLIVLLFAIIIFVFTGQPTLWLRLFSRLMLLPAIAALSYELIHFAADHVTHGVVQIIMHPSLALQRLVTRQPDIQQIEVAIEALQGVREPDDG